MLKYKGYIIVFNLYGQYEYTIQYCGDELFFYTLRAAHEFIDNL